MLLNILPNFILRLTLRISEVVFALKADFRKKSKVTVQNKISYLAFYQKLLLLLLLRFKGIILPSIFEKHKICSNRIKSLLLVN